MAKAFSYDLDMRSRSHALFLTERAYAPVLVRDCVSASLYVFYEPARREHSYEVAVAIAAITTTNREGKNVLTLML